MTSLSFLPTDDALSELAFSHLQAVVGIDSQSDETSDTIPSSEGQRRLAEHVAAHFSRCGFTVERDGQANVIAFLPGQKNGAASTAEPLALMVHLDTARGTGHPERLHTVARWDGKAIPFPKNPSIRVDVAHYPDLARFLGHTVVHGDGVVPFGLDDKLGLTHLMTLAELFRRHPGLDRPPLYLIGRPDEEIGRMEAVESLAESLAINGVRSGFTVDGILPFEVNVANFNAAHTTAVFAPRGVSLSPDMDTALELTLGGVNTHGATAFAEGHRTAVRFAAELLVALQHAGLPAHPHAFRSDALRDCDGVLTLWCRAADTTAITAHVEAIVRPHIARGASWSSAKAVAPDHESADTTAQVLMAVSAFAASRAELPGEGPLWAEDSSGWQGYSHPYRVRHVDGGLALDVRIRDFDPTMLEARKAHSLAVLGRFTADVTTRDQYVNMGPRLESRRDLVDVAVQAGLDVGVEVVDLPIRGGTGVDPFLDRGTAIANLGTGYFAPESEKELTTLELMAHHAKWLVALCARLA